MRTPFSPARDLQTVPTAVRPGCDQRRDAHQSCAFIENARFERFATASLPSRDTYLGARQPYAVMHPHRKHIPTTTFGHGIAQRTRLTVDLICRHPAHRHAQPPRMAQHRNRQFTLGGKNRRRQALSLPHSALCPHTIPQADRAVGPERYVPAPSHRSGTHPTDSSPPCQPFHYTDAVRPPILPPS